MSDKLNFCTTHGCTYVHECHYCWSETQNTNNENVVVGCNSKEKLDSSIESIQADRGSVYGRFSEQAKFVGKMIHEFEMVAVHNDVAISNEQRGAIAYIAIKLARYAVSPKHVDTLVDLESYCNLIKKMEVGDEV